MGGSRFSDGSGGMKRCFHLAQLYRKAGELAEARYLYEKSLRTTLYFPQQELEELAGLCREIKDVKSAEYYEGLSKLAT